MEQNENINLIQRDCDTLQRYANTRVPWQCIRSYGDSRLPWQCIRRFQWSLVLEKWYQVGTFAFNNCIVKKSLYSLCICLDIPSFIVLTNLYPLLLRYNPFECHNTADQMHLPTMSPRVFAVVQSPSSDREETTVNDQVRLLYIYSLL